MTIIKVIILIILRLSFTKNYFTLNGSLEKKYFKITKSNVIRYIRGIDFLQFLLLLHLLYVL